MNKEKLQEELEAKKELLSTPFDTVKEKLEHEGLSVDWLCDMIGLSTDDFEYLMKGVHPLTVALAYRLDLIFGIEQSFWLNLQANYEQELKEIEELEKAIQKL